MRGRRVAQTQPLSPHLFRRPPLYTHRLGHRCVPPTRNFLEAPWWQHPALRPSLRYLEWTTLTVAPRHTWDPDQFIWCSGVPRIPGCLAIHATLWTFWQSIQFWDHIYYVRAGRVRVIFAIIHIVIENTIFCIETHISTCIWGWYWMIISVVSSN